MCGKAYSLTKIAVIWSLQLFCLLLLLFLLLLFTFTYSHRVRLDDWGGGKRKSNPLEGLQDIYWIWNVTLEEVGIEALKKIKTTNLIGIIVTKLVFLTKMAENWSLFNYLYHLILLSLFWHGEEIFLYREFFFWEQRWTCKMTKYWPAGLK